MSMTEGVEIAGARKLVPINQLRTGPWNPRTISRQRFTNLCRTIAVDPGFLWNRPVLAMADGEIYAGNMRYRAVEHLWTKGLQGLDWASAAAAAGIEPGTVPAIVEDVPPDLARERAIRDNAQWGEWQEQELAEMVYELAQGGTDTQLLGLTDKELAALIALSGADGDSPTGEDPGAQEPPLEPNTKRGDIWLLGQHRLMCGDALDLAERGQLFGDRKARLIVTSPPYNQNIDSFKPSGMQKENPAFVNRMAGAYADSLPEDDYQAQQVELLDGLWDMTSDDASIFYNHKHRYREMRAISPLLWVLRSRWTFRQEIVWDRTSSITLNARMFMPSDERLYWLFKGNDFYFKDSAEVKAWSTVWRIAPVNELQVSAPFPNEIPERPIRACTDPGDVVYDPYGGSGTTLIAAARLDRIGLAMEIEPRWCDAIVARWEAMTNQHAVLEQPAHVAA